MGALKAAARREIDRQADELVGLSERLHADPETAWEEHRAAAAVPELLDRAGFEVTSSYLGLETAFLARFGSGPTRIALCAEYDALPGLGHACGHNLIAASSVGAALGLAAVADEAGLTVEVYGTPAEEGGGGKIEMLDRGAFAGVDLAMMAHPAPVDVAEARPFAVTHSKIAYTGKSAHAAAYPEAGVNAADAFTVAQVAIGLLRQQLPPSARVHGVVTHAGDAPNAIRTGPPAGGTYGRRRSPNWPSWNHASCGPSKRAPSRPAASWRSNRRASRTRSSARTRPLSGTTGRTPSRWDGSSRRPARRHG